MLKYIRFEESGFVLFKRERRHTSVAKMHEGETPISAGFVADIKGDTVCFGESMTLGIQSASCDTDLLNRLLRRV